MDIKYNQAIESLCLELYTLLKKVPEDIQSDIREICIRAEKPIILMSTKGCLFLRKDGKLTRNINFPLKIVSQREIQDSIKIMCDNSIYSYDDEIKNGFLTIKGGHRIGICGTAVLKSDLVTNIRDISSLNVRIARQIKSSADELLSKINYKFDGLIVAGVPASGKTTILREIARKMSLRGQKVSVVDERNEFAGTYAGIAQNDLGFSDVLNGYPKAEGLIQAIRTLSPDIIVCDEIGGEKDILAITKAVHAGVKLVVGVHAGSIDDFLNRKQCFDILKTGSFDILTLMVGKSEPGKISGIYKVGENIDKISRIDTSDSFVNSNGVYGIA